MIKDIYNTIIQSGFSSKNQDVVSNKRLGIKKSFNDKKGNYIEVYKETYGYSVFVFGSDFVVGYYPWNCHILFKKDISILSDKLENTLA